jgi:hypothetical protein
MVIIEARGGGEIISTVLFEVGGNADVGHVA